VQTTRQELKDLKEKQAAPDGAAPLSQEAQSEALKKAQEAIRQQFRQAVLPSFSQFWTTFSDRHAN